MAAFSWLQTAPEIVHRAAASAAAAPDPARRTCSRRSWCAQRSKQSFVMLRPDIQWKNPVMFVVEVGAVLTLLFVVAGARSALGEPGAGHAISSRWTSGCS